MDDRMCTCCSCCPAQEGSDYCEDCQEMLSDALPDDWVEIDPEEGFIKGDKVIW